MAALEIQRAATVLLVVCVVWSGCSARAFAATSAADVTALNALLKEWGPNTPDLNWAGDPCLNSWVGVTCDDTGTTVTALSLDSRGVTGRLPPEIGGLANLETLELSVNRGLTGDLPKELGNLRKLSTLSLQWCSFTGQLPREIGNLVELQFLGVNGNNLTGPIPDVIGNLKKLTWLDISQNQLSDSMPVSTTSDSSVGLDSLTEVMHFHFNNNTLSGPIPPEIFSLPNLIHLILDHNNLSGEIPAEVSNGKSLQIIRMDFNQLEGPIPPGFSNVTNLTDLNFRHNKLTGVMPDLSGLALLQGLDLSENNFDTQEFPSWALEFPDLQSLYLGQCSIVGQLPPDVFKLPMIVTLDLQRNQLNGSLTFSGSVSGELKTVVLDNNAIDGFVGEPLLQSGGRSTVEISLYNNPLCNNEFIAPVGSRACSAYIPTAYQAVQENCTMSCNKRKMLNPKSCICGYPLQLNLWLTAPSSMNLQNRTRLSTLETELSIKISNVEDSNVTLESSQVWIKDAFTSLDSRISLDIYFFPLSGDSLSRPEQDAITHSLRQHKFSISEGPFNLPSDSFSDYAGAVTLSTVAIALIAAAGAIGFFFLIGVILYAARQRRNARRADNPFASWGEGDKNNKHGAAPKMKTARHFSLAELKAATNNWHEVLGEGGYGKVYKGTLKSGEVVAIKRANKDSMQGLSEFRNELELLSRVHHRNLVDLVGFCYETGEQLLVYEFMSSGTLRERLYERVEIPVSWQMRLDIILNSARGLAYLHDHASPPIIHGDIKSANILLNHKMLAKVADFGLSKPTSDEGDKILYSDEIRGTRGYLDPEYFQTHIHTDKSDVFSFGVVMVEALTGKSPTHGGKDRTREFRTAFEKGGVATVRPLMDPFVEGIPDNELEAYIVIALKCTEEYGEDRLTMTEVVKGLESITGGTSSRPTSGVHQIDMPGNKSPEFYSDKTILVNDASSSFENSKGKDGEGNAFQYSGAFGVTTTIQPK